MFESSLIIKHKISNSIDPFNLTFLFIFFLLFFFLILLFFPLLPLNNNLPHFLILKRQFLKYIFLNANNINHKIFLVIYSCRGGDLFLMAQFLLLFCFEQPLDQFAQALSTGSLFQQFHLPLPFLSSFSFSFSLSSLPFSLFSLYLSLYFPLSLPLSLPLPLPHLNPSNNKPPSSPHPHHPLTSFLTYINYYLFGGWGGTGGEGVWGWLSRGF